jgi:hypothetical protein
MTEVFILALRKRMPAAIYMECVPVQPYFKAIAEAQERIARQPLATLDTFQQEPGFELLQFQVCRNRGVEVGGYVERRLHSLIKISSETGFVVAKKNPPPLSAEMGFVFFLIAAKSQAEAISFSGSQSQFRSLRCDAISPEYPCTSKPGQAS